MLERFFKTDFDEIYKIMEDSFPLTEFRPKEEQLALFDDSRYSVFGVRKNSEIVSIAAVWNFDELLFVEHLATSPEYRNQGLGKYILCEILKNSNNTICLEVEPPIDELTNRRVTFYERCGFCFNSHPYIQPSISKGRNPIPLFIMTSHKVIDKIEFQRVKNLLYKNVYKTEQPN